MQARQGYFDLAKGGTLFLDEIGTLPYSVQSVLLRVLQENTYIPVGDSKERHADVRIVAATNEDIPKAIAERRFREDLYHRLGEFEITQPPLRQCPEDILPLAEFFRKESSTKLRRIFHRSPAASPFLRMAREHQGVAEQNKKGRATDRKTGHRNGVHGYQHQYEYRICKFCLL